MNLGWPAGQSWDDSRASSSRVYVPVIPSVHTSSVAHPTVYLFLMSRRRVSRKVHTTEMAPVVEATLPEIAQTSAGEFWMSSHVCVGARANARKTVFKLPDETFLEILSYFPVIGFRYRITDLRNFWGANFLPGEYAERLDVLRAITQTCRTLRRKFLSWLWERVEACVVPGCSAWYIYVGNALESKCHILLKNPQLATHVRLARGRFLYSTPSHALSSTVRCPSPSHATGWM